VPVCITDADTFQMPSEEESIPLLPEEPDLPSSVEHALARIASHSWAEEEAFFKPFLKRIKKTEKYEENAEMITSIEEYIDAEKPRDFIWGVFRAYAIQHNTTQEYQNFLDLIKEELPPDIVLYALPVEA
jgi:hypothetical protein